MFEDLEAGWLINHERHEEPPLTIFQFPPRIQNSVTNHLLDRAVVFTEKLLADCSTVWLWLRCTPVAAACRVCAARSWCEKQAASTLWYVAICISVKGSRSRKGSISAVRHCTAKTSSIDGQVESHVGYIPGYTQRHQACLYSACLSSASPSRLLFIPWLRGVLYTLLKEVCSVDIP